MQQEIIKIAIHHREGSFSDKWINYCKENGISFKIVNCYDNDIISQLKDCNALMWHHTHFDYKDLLFSKQLLFSLEQTGIHVFPNFNTNWHFDDKVGQKYLLENIDAPIVPSYVFYSKIEALDWVANTTFPKVFKLRGGAGSLNVQLVKTKNKAIRIIKKAFGNGFKSFNRSSYLKDKLNKAFDKKGRLIDIAKGFGRFIVPPPYSSLIKNEKGYVYFQDFIPNNLFDIRVIIVNNKAFAIKRLTRKHDFRASGSGKIIYNKKDINENCVKIAYNVNKIIQSQCIAYDFIFDENNSPLIVEISYGFVPNVYDLCPGYWDEDLQWHVGKFNPYSWMVEDIIEKLRIKNGM